MTLRNARRRLNPFSSDNAVEGSITSATRKAISDYQGLLQLERTGNPTVGLLADLNSPCVIRQVNFNSIPKGGCEKPEEVAPGILKRSIPQMAKANDDPRLEDERWKSSAVAPANCAWICVSSNVCAVDYEKLATHEGKEVLSGDKFSGQKGVLVIPGIRYSGGRTKTGYIKGTKVNLTPYQLEEKNGWRRNCD